MRSWECGERWGGFGRAKSDGKVGFINNEAFLKKVRGLPVEFVGHWGIVFQGTAKKQCEYAVPANKIWMAEVQPVYGLNADSDKVLRQLLGWIIKKDAGAVDRIDLGIATLAMRHFAVCDHQFKSCF
jgi:hypothetical protein